MKGILPGVAPAGAAHRPDGGRLLEFRCRACNKLLARAACSALEIKCPRCGQVNGLAPAKPRAERP